MRGSTEQDGAAQKFCGYWGVPINFATALFPFLSGPGRLPVPGMLPGKLKKAAPGAAFMPAGTGKF
jgi:hypothetical protein